MWQVGGAAHSKKKQAFLLLWFGNEGLLKISSQIMTDSLTDKVDKVVCQTTQATPGQLIV